jgi:hypothetical protein
MFFRYILLAGLVAWTAHTQTRVDLRTQSKSVDFSAAITTKPIKTGTVLPAVCGAGEAFFNLNAPGGSNLYLCTSQNSWVLQVGTTGPTGLAGTNGATGSAGPAGPAGLTGANGAISLVQNAGTNLPVESILNFTGGGCTDDPTNGRTNCTGSGVAGSSGLNIAVSGVSQGSQPTLNFISGTGVVQVCTNNAAANRVDCTPALDTAFALSRSMDQAGTDHSIIATSGTLGGSFVANGSVTLITYTQNQSLNFLPIDHDCIGNDTINIDALGPIPLKVLSAGALVPVGSGGCKMGIPYLIIAVGSPVNAFRLI